MSRPESLVRATKEELHSFWGKYHGDAAETLAALVREVVAEKDAEAVEVRRSRDQWMSACDAEILEHRNTKARAERAEAEVARLTRERDEAVRMRQFAEQERDEARTQRDEWEQTATKAEAALADAQRAGADELQRKAFVAGASWVASYAQSTGELKFHSGPASTRYVSARAEAERRYAPPAPEPPSVRLGEWVVQWNAERKVYEANQPSFFGPTFSDPIVLCRAINYTPTPTEYAALVALQEGK